MKSSEYWAERFSALEERGFQQTESLAAVVDKIYRGAQKGIEDDLRAWYTRLAENNALSLQDAKRFLNTSELEEFRWTVEEYVQQAEQLGLSDEIKKKLENASARYHIRRLEAIQLQVEQRLAAATAKAEDTMLQELASTVQEISGRTMYEVQKGLNVGFNVSQIDEKTVQQLLHTGWSTDGKTFSTRLWENQQKLVSTLEQQLTQAIIQGKSLSQVVQQLTKTMESSRFNIARVVYTESAHAIETGKLTAYEELGVDELEIIATLDARTCATCGDLDGKTVRRTDAVSGVSIPPWHPRCRCTTAPAVDEKYGERIARNENGENYTVPADTTYEQWKEQQADAKIGSPIENRNSGSGRASAIVHFGLPLNRRQSRLLEMLPEEGSQIQIGKSDVNLSDLAAMTAKTGDEFAVFTRKGQRLIIRGDSISVPVNLKKAAKLRAEGFKWSGHTHPGADSLTLMPSDGDLEILKAFDQKQSVIYNSLGQYQRFEL